jgi:hypothetical protein
VQKSGLSIVERCHQGNSSVRFPDVRCINSQQLSQPTEALRDRQKSFLFAAKKSFDFVDTWSYHIDNPRSRPD